MNLLLVGFDSSDWVAARRSTEVISACTDVELDDHSVVSLFIPASWQSAFEPLRQMLTQNWDAFVLLTEKDCKGVAVERIAINELDPRERDEEGRRPTSKVIEAKGEPGYWTTLPYRDLCIRFNNANFHATASHSAGAGLANFVFYRTMQHLQDLGKNVPAGLIQIGDLESRLDSDRAKSFLNVLLKGLEQWSDAGDDLAVELDRLRSGKGTR